MALDATTFQPIAGNREDNNLTNQPFSKNIKFVSADIDYQTPWADLVSATSYSDTKTSQSQDASYNYGVALPYFGLPLAISSYAYKLHLKKFGNYILDYATRVAH